MALQDDLNRLQKQLGNFLFPRKCPFCGTVTGGRLLCGSCERTLPYTGENALRQGTFGRCASPLYYTGPVREAILRFKFQGRTGGLDCFGRLLADCAARWYPGEFDTVTWVPVSRKRLRQRGFDQSRLLAASLCRSAHLYVWDEPLNFVDLFSRIQMEELLLEYRPTLLFVEHDEAFRERVATRRVSLSERGLEKTDKDMK